MCTVRIRCPYAGSVLCLALPRRRYCRFTVFSPGRTTPLSRCVCMFVRACSGVCVYVGMSAPYVPTVRCIPLSEYLCLDAFTACCVCGPDVTACRLCFVCCASLDEVFVDYIRCPLFSLHSGHLCPYDIFLHSIQVYLLVYSSAGCHWLYGFIT